MVTKTAGNLSQTQTVGPVEHGEAINDIIFLPNKYQPVPFKLFSHLHRYLSPIILFLIDYITILMAMFSALWLRNVLLHHPFSLRFDLQIQDPFLIFIIPLFYFGLIFYEGLYHRRLPFWQSAGKLFKICTFATAFAIVLLYFDGALKVTSRLFIGFIWIFTCSYLIVARYLAKRVLAACGLWRQPVVIIGDLTNIEILAKSFREEPGLGYRITGIIERNFSGQNSLAGFPVIGNLNGTEAAVIQSGVSEVIIAMSGLERSDLLQLVHRVQPLVKHVTIVPELYGLPLNNLEADTFFHQKAVMLRVRNSLLNLRNRFLKRLLDLVFGMIILIPCLPVMAVISLMIALDSPGPVIYAGKRLGKNGWEFKCYKFRTMFINEKEILAEHLARNPAARKEWETYAKLREYDPRVTRVGRWLRKFSLDELPQIINVIKGEMSLVGPRPFLPSELKKMGIHAKTILVTVPGITGLWQVRGRNELEFRERLELDTWYIQNWSTWLDMTLLVRTVSVVVGRKGAY